MGAPRPRTLRDYAQHKPECLKGKPKMISGQTATGAWLMQDGRHTECSCGLDDLLTSPEAGTGWQDISTAPKDGTEVLLLFSDGLRRVGWFSAVEGWMGAGGSAFHVSPVQWFHLPDLETDACSGCKRVFPVSALHHDVEDVDALCDECYEDCPTDNNDEDEP